MSRVDVKPGRGLSTRQGLLHAGMNSGYQAINLACQFGCDKIILIGYDMQHTGGKSHWHGDHPKGLTNAQGIEAWVKHFTPLAQDCSMLGVEVVNCSNETALTCFRRSTLQAEL